MTHKSITKDGVTYTFKDKNRMGVQMRLLDFDKSALTFPILAGSTYLSGLWLMTAELMSVTAGIEGDTPAKALWAENHARPAADIWGVVCDLSIEDDAAFNAWWQAWQDVQAPALTTEEADFLAEKPDDSPSSLRKPKQAQNHP